MHTCVYHIVFSYLYTYVRMYSVHACVHALELGYKINMKVSYVYRYIDIEQKIICISQKILVWCLIPKYLLALVHYSSLTMHPAIVLQSIYTKYYENFFSFLRM